MKKNGIKECWICKSKMDLTYHHIFRGKQKHRDNNPFQSEWSKMDRKKVVLCKECHELLHNNLLFRNRLHKRKEK